MDGERAIVLGRSVVILGFPPGGVGVRRWKGYEECNPYRKHKSASEEPVDKAFCAFGDLNN